jgi:hypothetical protein
MTEEENWKHVQNGVYAQDLQEEVKQLNYSRKHNYEENEEEEKPAVSEIAVKCVKLEPIDDEQKADEDSNLLKKLKEKHCQELVEGCLRISRYACFNLLLAVTSMLEVYWAYNRLYSCFNLLLAVTSMLKSTGLTTD